MPPPPPGSRRAFLGNVGKGTIAAAVLSPAVLAACSSDASAPSVAAGGDPTAPTAESEQATTAAQDDGPTAQSEAGESPESVDTTEDTTSQELRWARAELGFVSAYVLARGNTAAIVDTGLSGNAAAIGETLAGLGLNYSDVAHVILTHGHSDHAGSIEAVLAEAINATAYAGEADLAGIRADGITGLLGGEDVFGFEMLSTPGHTDGHMAVIDHQAGVLVAGDAVFTEGGGVVEGPERFFSDIPESRESIKAMAALSFNTLLVGHGDPIEVGADSAVAALAASF